MPKFEVFPSPSECKILREMDSEGTVPTEEIISTSGKSKGAVSVLLHRLVGRGYVEVDYHREEGEDFQVAFWSLTPFGLAMKEFLLDWGLGL